MEDRGRTEAAEPQKAAGVPVELKRLVMRFEEMAEVREKHALEKRMAREDDGEGFAAIAGLEGAAKAYRRCAEEVQRVINGELPADPGMRWD